MREMGKHLETILELHRSALELLLQGCTLDDFARKLCVNPKAVANHQSAIKQKLGAGTAAQLVRTAMRLGLVPRG
jgi:two-component system, NarL family, invasion response regulator UvrY